MASSEWDPSMAPSHRPRIVITVKRMVSAVQRKSKASSRKSSLRAFYEHLNGIHISESAEIFSDLLWNWVWTDLSGVPAFGVCISMRLSCCQSSARTAISNAKLRRSWSELFIALSVAHCNLHISRSPQTILFENFFRLEFILKTLFVIVRLCLSALARFVCLTPSYTL